jgi:ssRNA-specific RNase YbeY (16S rRNA maturation enzyme)
MALSTLLHSTYGWDHTDETETEAMQTVEQEILTAAGLPHPLRERG